MRRALALVLCASALALLPAAPAASVGEAPGASVVLRTYRLALLSDPAYAAAVAPTATTDAESDAQVLAAKGLVVDRLNQLFGEELAIRFVLAPGSIDLNLRTTAEATAANGPCGAQPCFTPDHLASCTDDTLRRTRLVIGQLLGARSYEIGHLLLGSAAGGAAYPATAGTEYRAFGCSGSPTPSGDGFVVDRVAHELGHQLGASPTFDGVWCEEDRNQDTAVEPGSGTSIMGGAGTCGVDDVQADADPWFSTVSRAEVGTYVVGDGAVPEDALAMEVQSVAFKDFDGSDSFKLSFAGVETAPITRGVNYNETAIKAAVLAAVPEAIISKVRPFWQTGVFDDRGFELTFASFTDVVEPTVVPLAGTFTAAVNDIDQGGLQAPGGTAATSANHHPVVTAPADRTIPLRTPFALTGTATDADGDPLVYQWEQADLGGLDGLALTDPAKTDGPLFRTPVPAASATRTFPDLAQVVAGHTNAETGTCAAGPGAAECYAEWLPTAAYTPTQLHFRLVARDRDAAGGVANDEVTLTVDKTTGPFRVTSHAEPAILTGGTSQTVTWTANTAALAADVRIRMSTDGGETFGTVLAATTPNDGSHTVTLPDVDAAAVRFMVEAVDGYFFDVSDADVSVTPPPAGLTVTGVPAAPATQHSDPLVFAFAAESSNAPPDALTADLTGLPSGLSLAEDGPGSWAVTGTALAPPGTYPVHLEVTDGVDTKTFDRNVVVTGESATATYDGPTEVAAPTGGPDAVDLALSATVVEVPDGTPAPLSTATLTFTDATTGEVLCGAVPVSDAGTASCTHSADLPATGGRTYQVVLSLGGSWVGGSSAPTAVVVTAPGPPPPAPPTPPTPPETWLTSGPPTWLLSSSTSVAYASSEAGSTFVCRLDGVVVACTSSPLTLSGLSAGTHRLTVAARDAEGSLDPTPAATVFTVPVDDRRLSAGKRWKRRTSAAAYRGTYTAAATKKAALTYRVSGVEALALVVGTGTGHGRVRVYLGGVLVGRVRLSGPHRFAKVVPLAAFASPRSGVVRIVTRSGKPVRIDGLGVRTS
ncbi:M12 family metallo-peptidase [Nocardioides dilutus]